MKRIKKLASMLLAMIMVLAMTMTAFATEDTAPEATPAPVKHTYEIYQIFTGDYDKGVLSNIMWGANGTGTEGEKVAEGVLDALEAVKDSTSDTEKLAVILEYANLESTPVKTGSETEYTGLTPGYYLVKDQDESLNGTNVPYTLYVVQVVDSTLSFTPKGDVPTPDKKIVEGEDKVTANEASIGDTVNYEITGTMPSNIDDYNTYYYKFTDTLSEGLTFNEGSIHVTVGGVDATRYFYKKAVVNDDGKTIIDIGIEDIKALAAKKVLDCDEDHDHEDDCYVDGPQIISSITPDTKVVVTYNAKLNENAVIGGTGNPNDVKLTYSNDPNNSGDGPKNPPENPDGPTPDSEHPTGETPKVTVVTYTTELEITKINEDGDFLPGVVFTLTGNGLNTVLVKEEVETFVPDPNGVYWLLANGTYTKTAPILVDETDEDGNVTLKNNVEDYASTTDKYTKKIDVVVKQTAEENGVKSVVGTVTEEGTVIFRGLGAGEYTLEETTTLPGYNTIDPIEFTIEFNPDEEAFSIILEDEENKVTLTDNKFTTTIVNKSGSLLPSTGGIGTTIFYVVGSILVIGAGILLVAKKRMSANK